MQEQEMVTLITAEVTDLIDPFADFDRQLKTRVSGFCSPNSDKDLTDLCAFISKRDEEYTLTIIRNASVRAGVDLPEPRSAKSKLTSKKALELLLSA